MDTRTRWLAVMAALGTVAGCAEGPSAGVLQTARVFPANYRAELVAYLRNFLNDPTGVRNAYLSEPALMRLQGEERYVSCVRFDAKNSYGGYRGSRDHLATYDPTRRLRLAGTMNRKDERKGREPRRCEVIECSSERYDMVLFERFAHVEIPAK